MVFGPAFAARDPLVKMMGTLGLALILLGLMAWRAPSGGAFARFLPLPTTEHRFELFGAVVNWTQVISLAFAVALTAGTTAFLRFTASLGTAMRALANDREITRDARRARPPGRGGGVARLRARLRHGRAAARRPAHDARLHGT